jgi:hypothetical protein
MAGTLPKPKAKAATKKMRLAKMRLGAVSGEVSTRENAEAAARRAMIMSGRVKRRVRRRPTRSIRTSARRVKRKFVRAMMREAVEGRRKLRETKMVVE